MQLQPPTHTHPPIEDPNPHMLTGPPPSIDPSNLDFRHAEFGEGRETRGCRTGFGDAQDTVEDVERDGDEDVGD